MPKLEPTMPLDELRRRNEMSRAARAAVREAERIAKAGQRR